MTQYRTVHNGHWEELQYLKTVEHKFLWFKWKKSIWCDVPTPYYDSIYGRFDETRCYINSLRHNPERFVKENPDIEPYLEKTYKTINDAINIRNQRDKLIEERRGKIKNL